MADYITEITEAAKAATDHQGQLRYIVACAVADGVPVAEAARAAGVIRQTVYRWVAEYSDPAVDVIWRGERVRVEPEGVPPRIRWMTLAQTLTDMPVTSAGLVGPDVRDLKPGQATVLEVVCRVSGSPEPRSLHYRVELAEGDRHE